MYITCRRVQCTKGTFAFKRPQKTSKDLKRPQKTSKDLFSDGRHGYKRGPSTHWWGPIWQLGTAWAQLCPGCAQQCPGCAQLCPGWAQPGHSWAPKRLQKTSKDLKRPQKTSKDLFSDGRHGYKRGPWALLGTAWAQLCPGCAQLPNGAPPVRAGAFLRSFEVF